MTRHDRNQYLLSAAALGMSALAMFFAFMELRSSDRQFDASVWPYVDLTISLSDDQLMLDVSNKGMGPALIHEFRLSHPDHGEIQAMDLIHLSGAQDLMTTSTTTSLTQSVMPVGDVITAFRFEGEGIGAGMRAWGDRMIRHAGKPRVDLRYRDTVHGTIGFWVPRGSNVPS